MLDKQPTILLRSQIVTAKDNKCVYSQKQPFPGNMEYQKNEYGEPVKKDKAQIVAKILVGLSFVAFLAILGFIIWVAWHVFTATEPF